MNTSDHPHKIARPGDGAVKARAASCEGGERKVARVAQMRADDPDETEGRALSRAIAEKEVWLADWLAGRRRKAKLIEADTSSDRRGR